MSVHSVIPASFTSTGGMKARHAFSESQTTCESSSRTGGAICASNHFMPPKQGTSP